MLTLYLETAPQEGRLAPPTVTNPRVLFLLPSAILCGPVKVRNRASQAPPEPWRTIAASKTESQYPTESPCHRTLSGRWGVPETFLTGPSICFQLKSAPFPCKPPGRPLHPPHPKTIRKISH